VDLAVRIVVLVLVVAGFWLAFQPRYAFVVHIKQGELRVAKGKVTAAFLRLVGEVCGEFGVSRGWVGGVRRGRRLRLAFSRHVPEPCRQRLRNLWVQEGW
jgi:hypothetical protein